MDFKYKIGDKVMILDRRNIKDFAGGYVPMMREYVGAIGVISRVLGNYEYPAYRLENIPFTWDERILCHNSPRIEKNGIATIVFWNDGTKTIVKRAPDEQESDYAAFTAALAIRVFGSNSAVKRIVASAEEQNKKKKKKRDEYGKIAKALCEASKALIKAEANLSYDQQKTDEWLDGIEKGQYK